MAVNRDKPHLWEADVAPNIHLNLYPTRRLQLLLAEQPSVIKEILEALREIAVEVLVLNGRTYGGGLHKMEPKELGNVRIHVEELDGIVDEAMQQGVLFSLEDSRKSSKGSDGWCWLGVSDKCRVLLMHPHS